MPGKLSAPTLVLNSSYEAISVVTARRAVKMWAKGIAHVEKTYDVTFYRGMPVPSVVRLTRYRKVPIKKHTISRRNIFLRDRQTCQYCGGKPGAAKLTLDHVKPKSKGGAASWENLVAACHPCNRRKADHTPEEVGMILARRPKAMDLVGHRTLMRNIAEDIETWKEYLYF